MEERRSRAILRNRQCRHLRYSQRTRFDPSNTHRRRRVSISILLPPSLERRSPRRRANSAKQPARNPRSRQSGHRFEPVTQRVVIAAFEASLFTLTFSSFHQVLQAAGTLGSRFSAFGAAAFALLPQLILSLARDRQVGEFIFYRSSHVRTCNIVE